MSYRVHNFLPNLATLKIRKSGPVTLTYDLDI